MEERIDLKKQGKLKSNITRFRQDKRLAVTGALHSLALLGMLACVVFGIFRYQEDLRPENLQRMASYLKAAGSLSDPFTEYRFEAGLDTLYAPFSSGLAVSSGDTYSFISGLGDSSFSLQLRYNHPALCTSDNFVLTYDRGGTGIAVTNSYAEYLRTEVRSPILNASMNRSGAFTLITDEDGYRSGVSVYDEKQQLLCQWLTTEYYVLFASVDPESDWFAVAGLGQGQGELSLSTKVLYFRIGETQPSWEIDLGQRQIYAMTHDKSGGLVILCDDGADRWFDGERTHHYAFRLPVRLFSVRESGETLVAFESTDRSSRTTDILVLGDKLEQLWSGSFYGVPRALDCAGGTAGLLMNDRLEVIHYDSEVVHTHRVEHSGARDLVMSDDGEPILVYSDRAVKVTEENEAHK